MLKRMLIMSAGLLVVFGGIFGWKWLKVAQTERRAEAMSPPSVTVSAITVRSETWHPVLHAIATLRAVQGTDISPELGGLVSQISFESGQQVRSGDVLVQLDVLVELAQLQGLEAEESLAKLELTRVQNLAKTQIVPQSDLDQAQAAFKQAHAAVESQKQLIGKKTIRAPFSGLAGIRQISLGDYLAAGDPIVTLQALQPIYADFSLPQQEFSQVNPGQTVILKVDAYPGWEFEGEVSAINAKVDEATRNFAVRATLNNRDLKLRPGMFSEISVLLPDQQNVVTLPRTAISFNPYGDSVFVIREEGASKQKKPRLTVRRVFVQTGEQRGTQVAILKGVLAGQQVVTSGQMKLQEGSDVEIDNKITPVNQASVIPEDEN